MYETITNKNADNTFVSCYRHLFYDNISRLISQTLLQFLKFRQYR